MEAFGAILLILVSLVMCLMGEPGIAAAGLLPAFGLLVLASK